MLTRAMCAEWAPSGVQVSAIGPGYFDTQLTSALVNDEQFTAWLSSGRRRPAGGSRRSSSAPLLYLASPASDFVNGQILYVDGGMSAVL